MVRWFTVSQQKKVGSKKRRESRGMPYMYTHSSFALRILEDVNAVKWVRVHGGHDPAGVLNKIIGVSLAVSTLYTKSWSRNLQQYSMPLHAV